MICFRLLVSLNDDITSSCTRKKETRINKPKESGKTRQWLADQCGVKYLVVNAWFQKNRTIPKKAMIIIDNLMSQPKPSGDSQVSIPDFDINLKVSPDKFLEFNKYAKSCGMNIVDWIIYVLEYAGDNKELLLKRLQEEKDKEE